MSTPPPGPPFVLALHVTLPLPHELLDGLLHLAFEVFLHTHLMEEVLLVHGAQVGLGRHLGVQLRDALFLHGP